MKQIPLTQGQVAIVDDEDYDALSAHRWYAHWSNRIKGYYATRHGPRDENYKQETILMHRVVMGLKKGDGEEVDHKSRNTLDNRKGNLHIVDRMGNMANRKDRSKYGVGVTKVPGGYRSQIQIDGVKTHIGIFDTPEKASRARTLFLKSRITLKGPSWKPSIYGTGVTKTRSNRYVARVRMDGQEIHLGTFETVEDARYFRGMVIREREHTLSCRR